MLSRPDTPGVYIQPIDADRGALSALRTDIAGFFGIAERGPIGVAVAIRSIRQFESVFGGYIGGGYLAYAVRGFFENGGSLCRVVRVAAVEAASAGARLRLADGRFGLAIAASGPGTWGNAVSVRITPSRRAETLALAGGDARTTPVATTQGLERRGLARISQGAAELWRIIAGVDPVAEKVFWTHPDPTLRRPDEMPLAGIDTGQPFRIERIDYDVSVFERGRLVATYAALSAVRQTARFAPDILRLPETLTGPIADDGVIEALGAPPPPVLAQVEDGSSINWAGVPVIDPSGAALALAGGVDGIVQPPLSGPCKMLVQHGSWRLM